MFSEIPQFLWPESWHQKAREQRKREEAAEKKYFEEVLAPNAVDWDPGFGKKGLNAEKKVCFKASTFTVAQKPLFDAKPCKLSQKNLTEPNKNDILGPIITHGKREIQWVYRHAILPRGESLWLRFGNAKGDCYFDDDVIIPILYHYRPDHWERKFLVWMSHAPMEMITQRTGIKHCSGNVCIGGYGMGWFLEQVAQKRSVKSITVVEKSPELLKWFARRHAKQVAKETGTPIKIVCEDVFPYLAEHHEEFDKIALDIFKSYGNNNAEDDVRVRDLLYPNNDYHRWNSEPLADLKKKLWCWGSVKIGRKERIRYI